MLDDLRQQASSSFDEEEVSPPAPPLPARFLGMTPFQTFVIALLLLFITCILSAACLLVTGRVDPTFF